MSPRSQPEYQRSAKRTCKRTNPLGSVILITQLSEGRHCPDAEIQRYLHPDDTVNLDNAKDFRNKSVLLKNLLLANGTVSWALS